MWLNDLDLLVCPVTRRPLLIEEGASVEGGQVLEGMLREPVSGARYPVIKGIPRFVSSDNYAESFGFEWNTHARTQHDSYTGLRLSRERFEKETRWGKDLTGDLILEAGCGAGRFTPFALETGARVVSIDYSSAVEANARSNGGHRNLLIVQADIRQLPFREGQFDKCFCLGVLQHTPDPRQSLFSLISHLKPGGRLATDIYDLRLRNVLGPKYLVRPFTRNMESGRLYRLIKAYVDFMWPLSRLIRRIPRLGKSINWVLLVADYSHQLGHSDDQLLKEWAYLDTFDMLAPAHDHPVSLGAYRKWFQEAGLEDIDIHHGYNGIEGRGTKPRNAQ